MRRYMTTLCLVGILGAGAAAASAAVPTHRGYSGSGRDSWNQGGTWVRHGSTSFRFTTSGKYFYASHRYHQYISYFHGSYTASCSSRTLHVTAYNILIHQKTGRFNHSFQDSRTHARFTVWGAFRSGGDRAKVNYRITFSSGCASLVRGTATIG